MFKKSLVRVNTNRDGIGLLAFIVITLKTAVVAELVYVGAGQCLRSSERSEQENSPFKQAPANLAGLSYHEAVAKAIPSVVRIYTTNNGATAGIEKRAAARA